MKKLLLSLLLFVAVVFVIDTNETEARKLVMTYNTTFEYKGTALNNIDNHIFVNEAFKMNMVLTNKEVNKTPLKVGNTYVITYKVDGNKTTIVNVKEFKVTPFEDDESENVTTLKSSKKCGKR